MTTVVTGETQKVDLCVNVCIGVNRNNLIPVHATAEDGGRLLYWDVTIQNQIFKNTIDFYIPGGVDGRKIEDVKIQHIGRGSDGEPDKHQIIFKIYPSELDQFQDAEKPERIDIHGRLIIR